MSEQDLPEKRFADILDSIGAFAPAFGFKKQIGYLDENRLDDNDRAIAILAKSENVGNSDHFQDINITLVILSKKTISDGTDTRIIARQIQQQLINTTSFGTTFGIINQGMTGPTDMDSGRQAVILSFQMMSSYCNDL